MHSRRLIFILLLGDLLVLLAFVVIGRISHGFSADSIRSGIITATSLVLPWLIAVFAVGALPTPDVRHFILRSLAVWLIAMPLGLLLRALLLGSNAISVSFMITTLLLGGAFILGWRLLYAIIWLRRTRVMQPS